jgi:hypothetical protein
MAMAAARELDADLLADVLPRVEDAVIAGITDENEG